MRKLLIVALGAALFVGCGGSTAKNNAATRTAAATTIPAAAALRLTASPGTDLLKTAYPGDDMLRLFGVNATDVLHLPGWAVTAGDVADDATWFPHSQMAKAICPHLDNQTVIALASTLDSAKLEALGNSVPNDLVLTRSMYEEGCVKAGFLHNLPTTHP